MSGKIKTFLCHGEDACITCPTFKCIIKPNNRRTQADMVSLQRHNLWLRAHSSVCALVRRLSSLCLQCVKIRSQHATIRMLCITSSKNKFQSYLQYIHDGMQLRGLILKIITEIISFFFLSLKFGLLKTELCLARLVLFFFKTVHVYLEFKQNHFYKSVFSNHQLKKQKRGR